MDEFSSKILGSLKSAYLILGQVSLAFLIVGVSLIYISSIDREVFLEVINKNLFGLGPTENIIFYTGIAFLYLSLLNFLLQQLWPWIKIAYFRKKYSLTKLETTFYVFHLKGIAYLFDNCTKEIRWIENWSTASDLELLASWTSYDKDLKTLLEESSEIKTVLGKSVDLREFHWGKGIRTRGIPGT